MNFDFRLPNYKHQQEEWERHRDDDARALLWQMRTGKTKATLDLACYRYLKGDITGVLVVAPNGVHVNWIRRQLPQHMWKSVPYMPHAWQASEAKKSHHMMSLQKCLTYKEGLAILAVNSESIVQDKPSKLIAQFLKAHKGKCMLVVDESQDFRSPGAKRTKRARALKRYCKVRRILTGTPVSNSPLAAYSQFELLADGALGFTRFDDFQNEYAVFKMAKTRGGREFSQLDRYINMDKLQDKLAEWASVVLREDVDDMPSLIFDERTVLLAPEQQEQYDELTQKMILELESGADIEATEAAVRLIKLQQILGGFAVDTEGNLQSLIDDESNPRLQAVLNELEGSEKKTIIWCKFREDIRRVVRTLDKNGHRCVEYHGAIHSQQKRQEAIDLFNNDPSVRVFVGQPAAGGVGLDLSAADLIIWYSHTFNLIERDQANERATQIGGKTVTIVDFVTPGSVDEYILANLSAKRSVSEDLAGKGLRDKLLVLLKKEL